MIGAGGEDLMLKVPVGTIVRDRDTQEVVYDFHEPHERLRLCRGGRG